MKEQRIKITGSALITILLILVLWLVGCGGNTQAENVEPTEEVIPTEAPTDEVIPTDAPTEEISPTETPTEEVIPTEEIVELPEIFGKYTIDGIDPDNNNYKDTLEISATNGIFQWNWLSREKFGVGLYHGDMITVAWAKAGDCVAFSYSIQEDGTLEGPQTEMHETSIGYEKLTPRGEMGEGIEGTYKLEGITGGGDKYYNCEAGIANTGNVYEMYWRCGDIYYYGVGIQRGNIVSGAQAPKEKRCMFYSYIIEEDGTLDGIWALIGTSEIGTEVATPDTSE
jgi:hypothetical protein